MPLPLVPLVSAGAGLIQSLIGGAKARKSQRQLENLSGQVPQYSPNQSILDYYNQALARYNVSPTDTALYRRSMRDVQRNQAGALSTLQDRRSAIAGVPAVLRGANDASLNAEVAAEQQRNQRFNTLGSATGMKASEEQKAFQQNKMMPFNLKYNLLSQKAGAANQLVNAGLSNIFGGLQNWSNLDMMKQIYGDNSIGTVGNKGNTSGTGITMTPTGGVITGRVRSRGLFGKRK